MDDEMTFARRPSVPAGIVVGKVADIADGRARGFGIIIAHTRFHGFAVREGHRIWGYVDRCPHAAVPLARQLDTYLSEDGEQILCAWHGARFMIETGLCVSGPCIGHSLLRWPLEIIDDNIVTA